MSPRPDRQQVSTADVARSAVRRMEDQLAEVRIVLAHCEAKSPRDEDGVFDAGYYEAAYECPAYADVADRLRAILDGS